MNQRKDGRVAVIDADAMRRELLSRRLRREGYDVFSSDDGRKACPDSGLFDQGFVCMNHEETKCCKRPNGKRCTPLSNNRRLQRRLLR